MTAAEHAAAVELAGAMESAMTAAKRAGLPDVARLDVIARLIGYAVANGSPDVELTRAGVQYACSAIVETANQVFAERGAGMQPQGNA